MQAMRIRQATSVGEVGTGSQQNVVGGTVKRPSAKTFQPSKN